MMVLYENSNIIDVYIKEKMPVPVGMAEMPW